MGSSSTEPGATCWSDGETYPHQVTIGKGFCLKATEVTQDEWYAAMGTKPSSFSSCGGTCPVEHVSWWDAVAYCNKLSSNEGLQQCYTGCSGTAGSDYTCTGIFAPPGCKGYRLPTESEWEYAARAGTTTATYNGTEQQAGTCSYCSASSVLDPIAWWCGNAGNKTHPVGTTTMKANPWGLSDMLGNVWEWVEDCWHGSYDGDGDEKVQTPGKDHPTDGTAWQDGCSTGSDRVERGGGWSNNAYYVRAAYRYDNDPGIRGYSLGFRPARSSP
jgi:formylglycine-generating enzyme required for sulfatase activity